MVPFVVLTMARSGSKHLQYVLNMHPRVKMKGELLNRCFETMTDAELVGSAFRAAPKRRFSAVGFKVLHEQVAARPFTLPALLQVPDLRIIVLYRVDQLARLRSTAQAEATERWVVRTPPPDGGQPTMTLEPHWAAINLRWAASWYRVLAEELPPERTVWVSYEELTARQDEIMRPVWRLLGVADPGHLEAGTIRQEPRPLQETVTNLDQVLQYLAANGWDGLTSLRL